MRIAALPQHPDPARAPDSPARISHRPILAASAVASGLLSILRAPLQALATLRPETRTQTRRGQRVSESPEPEPTREVTEEFPSGLTHRRVPALCDRPIARSLREVYRHGRTRRRADGRGSICRLC